MDSITQSMYNKINKVAKNDQVQHAKISISSRLNNTGWATQSMYTLTAGFTDRVGGY